MTDKFKIINVVLVIGLCALSFIGGCVPTSYSENQVAKIRITAAKLDRYERLPHLLSLKYTDESIKGGYYFTYIPAFFYEPDNVRKPRDRYLKGYFFVKFREYGLLPGKIETAKYEISYTYSTSPPFSDGTFEHTFNLYINKNMISATRKVWWGTVSIGKAASSDISLYFDILIFKILEGFPKPQSTWKDFEESIKE